jgi:hypothetical protein
METPLGLSLGEFRKLTADLPDNAEIYIRDLETNVASIITQSYISNITHHQFFGVLLAPRTSQTNTPT